MKRRSIFVQPFFFLFAMVLIVGCVSPNKLVETGNYDAALSVAINRLAGKDKKKEIYVRALETAFSKVTYSDLDEIDRLKRNGRPEDWPQIYDLYMRLRRRQQQIQPLLPLVSKEGYQAQFSLTQTADLEQEAKEKSAEFFYTRAQNQLEQARKYGDKTAARRAYDDFNRTSTYFDNYRDRTALMREAEFLGTTFILVNVENRAPVILPAGLEQELLSISFRDLNDRWRVFHAARQNDLNYDFKITMELQDLFVSPEAVKEREYIDQKEVQDGFNYVLDAKGNVRKDTAGNDIKVPRMVKIQAFVNEVYQNKVAAVRGRLTFFDYHSNSFLETRPLNAESVFENYAATFRGDQRALCDQSRQRIGNRPLPFPDNATMLLEAARRLRPMIIDNLKRSPIS